MGVFRTAGAPDRSVAPFAASALVLLGTGWFLGFRAPELRAEARRAAREDLLASGDLRVGVLDAWIGEGLGDARTIASFPSVRRGVGAAPGAPDADIVETLADYARNHDIDGVAVLDREGAVRITTTAGTPPDPGCLAAARACLAAGAPETGHHVHADGTRVVTFAAPVRPPGDGAVAGVALLVTDAGARLSGRLRPRVGRSDGARVHLLAGPAGEEAVIPALDATGPPPPVRPWTSPIARTPVAPAADVDPEEYVDDRGVAVLAAFRHLGRAPWTVAMTRDAARVDMDAEAPIRREGLAFAGAVVAGVVVCLASGTVLATARRAEGARHARRTMLLLDQALDPILVATPDGRILEANQRAAEFYGRPDGGLAGLSIGDLVPPEDRPGAAPPLGPGEPGDYRVTATVHAAAGGRRVPVEIAERRVRWEGEEFLVLAVHDLSSRRAAEADLLASRERVRLLSTALDQAPVAVVITDPAGSIQYVNPQFTRSTGFSAEEVHGRNPRLLRSGAHPPEFYADLWRTITGGGTWRGEMQNRRKDGTPFWESVSISPVMVGERRIGHFVAMKEDVTARKRLEQEFLQAQKMESVGRLAGGVAHDFNNLLTVIGGFTELALVRTPEGDPRRPHLEQVAQASAKAAALTRHLLAFSRRQILQPRVMRVNDALGGSEKMLRRLMGETVRIVLDLEGDLPPILADPGQVDQAVMNLCVNARDAMPDGGTITLATRRAILDEAAAAARGVRAGTYAVVEVADTGTGIPEEIRARIFEPFFTTKEAGKGTGLGLAMVHGFATQTGGAVEVESEPGKGATFRLLLPVAPEGAAESRAPEDVPAALRGRESILVLDDEPAVAEIVRLSLARAGYEVRVAVSPEEAFGLVADPVFRIDLLVVDVVMPGMDGRRVATRVAALRPGVRVLFISGYSEDVISRHGVLEEGVHLLFKPFHPSAICARVREVLDGPAAPPPA